MLADAITTCRKRSEEDNSGASKSKEAPSKGKKKGKAPKKKKATPLKKKQKRNEAAPLKDRYGEPERGGVNGSR
jgi:hypothetical protein